MRKYARSSLLYLALIKKLQGNLASMKNKACASKSAQSLAEATPMTHKSNSLRVGDIFSPCELEHNEPELKRRPPA